jgi:hypothetical protein
MKRLPLPLLLLLLLSLPATAQTWEEWFRQKETQKEYLVQQIAALQAYAGTLRQGYEVLGQGINTVHQIKNGDLGLHQVFFHSLRQLNPAIGQSAKLTDMLGWQSAILRDFASPRRFFRQQLTTDELDYLEQVKTRVLQACARDMDALWLLLTSDQLARTDDERLRQLEALHQAMRGRFQFTRQFLHDTQLLALQREREKKNTHNLHIHYGLQPPTRP